MTTYKSPSREVRAIDESHHQLYRKVKGRLVPANDPWAYSGLRDGHWHVIVRPGSTSIRQVVWPDRMELEAALHDLEDQLVDLIRKASEARPKSVKLSPAEKRAWDNLITVGGDAFSHLNYQSIAGIAEEICGHVRGKMEERLTERANRAREMR